MPKLSEGDTIAMQGDVTMVHDDGDRNGAPPYVVPITTRGEQLSLVARKKPEPKSRKRLFDVPD